MRPKDNSKNQTNLGQKKCNAKWELNCIFFSISSPAIKSIFCTFPKGLNSNRSITKNTTLKVLNPHFKKAIKKQWFLKRKEKLNQEPKYWFNSRNILLLQKTGDTFFSQNRNGG